MPRFAGRVAIALTLLAAACSSPPPPRRSLPPAPVQRPLVRPAPPPAVIVPQKPTWVARKVVADAPEIAASTVTVAPGDTLSGIANRTGSGMGGIAAANKLAPPYDLVPGQVLRIPAGRYHRVKDGETGIAIARAYGVSWDSVIAANGLRAPYTLRVGYRLLLPTRRAVAAMSLEERARAFRLDIGDVITGSEPAAISKPVKAPTRAAATTKPIVEPSAFAGRFDWPLSGRFLSSFGPKPAGRYNDGVNIAAPAGTPVKAAADGVIAYAGNGIEGFGGLVLIKHGEGWVTAYAHNEALSVARGDKVTKGQVIARSGSTGSVDEPQLHFEIRRGRTPVDPARMLGPQK